MLTIMLMLTVLAAEPRPPFTSPKPSPPEYGYGVTAEAARTGWISLLDSKTTFGWTGGKMQDGCLRGGTTTSIFGDYELQADVRNGGQITIGSRTVQVSPGKLELTAKGLGPGPIRLGPDVSLRQLVIRPLALRPVFNGKDLSGWRVIRHPRLSSARQTNWSVDHSAILAFGGPGSLELDGRHGDLVLQLDVRTRGKLVNGGVFIRCVPGQFLNGYEMQVFNACYENDPAKPARFSTGAIDDRQLGRRLVSRDQVTFTMTVIAAGAHFATWVNGFQMTDWTDERDEHENPRQGRRLASGTIQLQAHDPGTNLQFSNIRIARIE